MDLKGFAKKIVRLLTPKPKKTAEPAAPPLPAEPAPPPPPPPDPPTRRMRKTAVVESRRHLFENARFRFVDCARSPGKIWQAEYKGLVGSGPKKTDSVASLRRALKATARRTA